jgi:hypothetical protein
LGRNYVETTIIMSALLDCYFARAREESMSQRGNRRRRAPPRQRLVPPTIFDMMSANHGKPILRERSLLEDRIACTVP